MIYTEPAILIPSGLWKSDAGRLGPDTVDSMFSPVERKRSSVIWYVTAVDSLACTVSIQLKKLQLQMEPHTVKSHTRKAIPRIAKSTNSILLEKIKQYGTEKK